MSSTFLSIASYAGWDQPKVSTTSEETFLHSLSSQIEMGGEGQLSVGLAFPVSSAFSTIY